mmetsp:Transcript_18168/g.54300  ORF Transcript_18168/g.54300 Transcript_18168/m.54300 type:complete len:361 (-) Transcript_18168:398-1480(-)
MSPWATTPWPLTTWSARPSSSQPAGGAAQSAGPPSHTRRHSSLEAALPSPHGAWGFSGNAKRSRIGGSKTRASSVQGTATTASYRRPRSSVNSLTKTRALPTGVALGSAAAPPSARTRKKFCRAPPEDSPIVHLVSSAYTPSAFSSASSRPPAASASTCRGPSGRLQARRPWASRLLENLHNLATGKPSAWATARTSSTLVVDEGNDKRRGRTALPSPKRSPRFGMCSKVWKRHRPKSSAWLDSMCAWTTSTMDSCRVTCALSVTSCAAPAASAPLMGSSSWQPQSRRPPPVGLSMNLTGPDDQLHDTSFPAGPRCCMTKVKSKAMCHPSLSIGPNTSKYALKCVTVIRRLPTGYALIRR